MLGLVDYDFLSSPSTTQLIPNVDIMKIATYYRVEENTFCRLVSLDETDLTIYDKIFFYSESERPITIPEAFARAPNIVYGGTYFTKEYVPHQNIIIDYTIPRISIYKEILKEKYQDGVKNKVIANTLENSYYRRYAGKEKLPLPIINPRRRCYVFDKNLSQQDWLEIGAYAEEKKASVVVPIHPIRFTTLHDFFTFRASSAFSREAPLILDLDMKLSELPQMFKTYTKYFLADITTNSNIYITLGESFPYRHYYYNDFIYKMNVLYAFWGQGIPIKIKYIYPEQHLYNPLQNLSLLIEKWSGGDTKKNISIWERTLSKTSIARVERESFLKIRPNERLLFNQTYDKLKSKGWRL